MLDIFAILCQNTIRFCSATHAILVCALSIRTLQYSLHHITHILYIFSIRHPKNFGPRYAFSCAIAVIILCSIIGILQANFEY